MHVVSRTAGRVGEVSSQLHAWHAGVLRTARRVGDVSGERQHGRGSGAYRGAGAGAAVRSFGVHEGAETQDERKFADEFFEREREYFGERRKSGGRKMKGADRVAIGDLNLLEPKGLRHHSPGSDRRSPPGVIFQPAMQPEGLRQSSPLGGETPLVPPLQGTRSELEICRENGDMAGVARIAERVRARLFDLSAFMKELKLKMNGGSWTSFRAAAGVFWGAEEERREEDERRGLGSNW